MCNFTGNSCNDGLPFLMYLCNRDECSAKMLMPGVFDFALTDDEMARISSLDLGRSAAYDDQDPENTRWIGTRKIHD